MSRGYRRFVLAAFGWVILAAAPQNNSATSYKAETRQRVEKATPQAAEVTPKALEPVPPGKYYRPCQKPYNERESDLCAQWKAADSANEAAKWAWWQFIVSILGLAGLIYTLRLTAKAASAAVATAETQIDAERPLIHLASARICQHPDCKPEAVKLTCVFWFANAGRTGAWMEEIAIAGGPAPDTGNNAPHEINAFVPVGKGFGGTEESPTFITFDESESKALRKDKTLYVWGYAIYRDAGKRRWKSGFIVRFDLDEALESDTLVLYHSRDHWADERLPTPKRRWYQRKPE